MEFRQVGSIWCHTSGQEDACKNDSRLMLCRICPVYHSQDKVDSDWTCWCWGRATQRRQLTQYSDLSADLFPKYPVLYHRSCNHRKALVEAASMDRMLEVLSWISLARQTLLRINSTLLSPREDVILKLTIVSCCTKEMLRHLQGSEWDMFKADPSSTWVPLFHAWLQ